MPSDSVFTAGLNGLNPQVQVCPCAFEIVTTPLGAAGAVVPDPPLAVVPAPAAVVPGVSVVFLAVLPQAAATNSAPIAAARALFLRIAIVLCVVCRTPVPR